MIISTNKYRVTFTHFTNDQDPRDHVFFVNAKSADEATKIAEHKMLSLWYSSWETDDVPVDLLPLIPAETDLKELGIPPENDERCELSEVREVGSSL